MAAPRIHIDSLLAAGRSVALSDNAVRHVQVLRLQPGAPLRLFDGRGGEWCAEIVSIGRRDVSARAIAHIAIEREAACAVTLALGMPANERMDDLIEKATELGVAAIQPLVTERSVLRVDGERAERKAARWQAIARAACEQCGRNRVPALARPLPLAEWLRAVPAADLRIVLSLDAAAPPLAAPPGLASALLLSGPEGGLSPAEMALAVQHGFTPTSLGPRVLRADTAPLAALARIAVA